MLFIWKCKYSQKLPDLLGSICLLKMYKELDLPKNVLKQKIGGTSEKMALTAHDP